MKTAIIILNYNNYEDTINCIESVESRNSAAIKYIVVDNGSTRHTAVTELDNNFRKRFCNRYMRIHEGAPVPATLPYLTFLVSPTNDGYARGNNKGLLLAYKDNEIDKVMILNNDILFVEDIIPRLVKAMDFLPDCGIVSPMLYKRNLIDIEYNCARKNAGTSDLIRENLLYYWYMFCSKRGLDRGHGNYILKNLELPYPQILPIELPSGSCMLVRKKTFREIGSFDPNTFLYYEEHILYRKMSRLGLKNYLCTRLKCIHLGNASSASLSSLFLVRCKIGSSRYYVKTYSGASPLCVFMHYISTIFFRISFVVQKTVMGKPL